MKPIFSAVFSKGPLFSLAAAFTASSGRNCAIIAAIVPWPTIADEPPAAERRVAEDRPDDGLLDGAVERLLRSGRSQVVILRVLRMEMLLLFHYIPPFF
ncbi:MAG: hypothetical protein MPW15_25640 [Candidatus Manganitrophus sp.]|nr:hypothetical protein [Candidatus Manganitrophus sp.]